MRLVDHKAMKRCRERGYCEYCAAYGDNRCSGTALHAAHIFSRGAGQVDIDGNLATLGAACHWDSHNGKITRDELLAIVAKRERTTPEAIEAEVWRTRRLPK